MINSGDPLPGKIVVSKLQEQECFVYVDSDIPKSSFKLRKDKEVEYSGVNWLNTKDAFIGTEVLDRLNRNQHRSNIVQFDLSGQLVERIYKAGNGELAWPLYSSRDDKYLLFTTHLRADPVKYPFEGLAPVVSLKIMDLIEKKVIKSIDSIGRSPNFHIEESPWLYDRYQFVYGISSLPQLKHASDEKVINPVEASEGVYLYDMPSGERKLLIAGGRSAIASPTSNQIAYEKDNSIRVLDLNTTEEKVIYKYNSKEQLFGKHWTPDGKHIYFAYKVHWGVSDLFHTGEKLIDVTTGREKPFRKIGHGFESYTWK